MGTAQKQQDLVERVRQTVVWAEGDWVAERWGRGEVRMAAGADLGQCREQTGHVDGLQLGRKTKHLCTWKKARE